MHYPSHWNRGDQISKWGYKYWYAWQGPEETFRGTRFDGPVAFTVDGVDYSPES